MATNPIAMRSSNPALSAETFRGTRAAVGEDSMTIQGTVNKTALCLLILMATASYTWNLGIADPRVPAFMGVGILVSENIVAASLRYVPNRWPLPGPVRLLSNGSSGYQTNKSGSFGVTCAVILKTTAFWNTPS